MDFDVVLLHPPFSVRKSSLLSRLRFWQKNSTIGEFTEMPMGFFPMASILEDEGVNVRIFNLALERALDLSLDLKDFLKSLEARVYAIDLHWFTHSMGALEVAELCKKHHPDSFVVLGGFTATYYDLEIMRSYPFVDAIACGESEYVLFGLLRALCTNGRIDEVDGITYRDQDSLKRNPLSPPRSLDSFKFTELDLMENWDQQLRCCARAYDRRMRPSFWLTIARGCINECIYCGGAHSCYQLLTGRDKPIVRGVNEVANDIGELAEKGVKTIKLNHDPEMFGKRFWSPLLDSVRNLGVDVSMYWESYRLPSKTFIEKATATFADLGVAISPESPSEDVRMLAGRVFTDKQMFDTIEFLEKAGVMTDIYFMIGLPGETLDSASGIIEFTKRISRNKHTLVQPLIPYTIDPHCPMALNPERYGVKPLLKSFDDYRRVCIEQKWEKWIGHETENLSQAAISELTASIRSIVMTLPQEGVSAKIAFDYEQAQISAQQDR